MELIYSSETSVGFQRSAGHYISQDSTPYIDLTIEANLYNFLTGISREDALFIVGYLPIINVYFVEETI
jgi:hypothetical protein